MCQCRRGLVLTGSEPAAGGDRGAAAVQRRKSERVVRQSRAQLQEVELTAGGRRGASCRCEGIRAEVL